MDRFLISLDTALRTLSGACHASRPCPVSTTPATPLDAAERRLSGALMRVNQVGEVCAQALYSAQALAARNGSLRRQFEAAAREESDHLAWTQQRLDQLGTRSSLLNPLWYAGAFGIGLLAARSGDPFSLGFVVETERQVGIHLEGHLEKLPARDLASRAIVRQMRDDEAKHAEQAKAAGGSELPAAIRTAMRWAGRVMTRTAHYV